MGIIRGAIKRPLDSSVESVKTCPKTSESEVCRSSDLSGAPLDAMSLGGRRPPSILIRRTGPKSLEQSRVRAREVCEASGEDNRLASQIREHGVAIHELSGGIDIQLSEPFDKLKVAVKRGEIDWLHIVLEISWMGQERVVTRLIKLCRVGHRRGIWWSSENPATSELWRSNRVRNLCEEGDVHCVHTLSSQVCTNVVAWDDQMDLGSLVHKFLEFSNRAPEKATPAEFTITADGASGSGVPRSSRAVREEENECAIGGLRNAARSVTQLPNWSLVGSKVGAMIEELVVHHEEVLNPVLDRFGDKNKSHMVPETLCAILRLRMKDMSGLCDEDLQPELGGFFPGFIRGLTEAPLDPDVHIHEWLKGHVRLGITVPIPPGGVFPVVSPQSVRREKDRIRHLHAKVWGADNYASYEEHKLKSDEILKNDISKGYVQWAMNREDIEQDVGPLQLAKIAVVVKGEKVCLIHDMRRNGTNSKVNFQERLVLPRVEDIVGGVVELLENKVNSEVVEFLTLDFRDALNSCTWWHPRDLSWLGPPWAEAWLSNSRAQTNCFVEDPIIPLKGTAHQRRRLAMGVLLWWLGTLSSKLQKKKKNSSKNTFIQKHFHPKTLSSKTISSKTEDNFIHDTFIQKRVHPMTLSSKNGFVQ